MRFVDDLDFDQPVELAHLHADTAQEGDSQEGEASWEGEAPAEPARTNDAPDAEPAWTDPDAFPDVIVEDLPDSVRERARWPAFVASLVFHLWLLSSLSSLMLPANDALYVPPIQSRIVERIPDEELEQQPVEYELANPKDEEHEQLTTMHARSVGASLTTAPKLQSAPMPMLDVETPRPTFELYDIPEGTEVDDRIVVSGTTGEGMVEMEAALDRVTWEIANNLQEKRVLVVWLIDASASLKEQRKIIIRRLERIYGELDALHAAGELMNVDQPLLTAVAAFGKETHFLMNEPTADLDKVLDAFDAAPIDDSGVENVFRAVSQVIGKWKHHRVRHGRRIMIITVTDEAGDDYAEYLESSIKLAQHNSVRAYVIGPPAAFGKRQAFVDYVAPEDGRTYPLPVDMGPETAVMENVQLPFWFAGPQFEQMSAGFGPYALSRLVRETGGVYFMTNMTTTTGLATLGSYDAQAMKAFEPDYRFGRPEQYYADIAKRPIRQAVVQAAALSLKYKARGTPSLELKVTGDNYLQQLSDAQKTVAESTLMIDNILTAFAPSLEAQYAKEASPRWRAAFNLSYGRLLAQRVRCFEYNSACAAFKLLGTNDINTKTNHWIFRPSTELNYGVSMKKQAMLAEKLLKRVLEEAPGTPWATMAARELKDPLGIRVVEKFIPPLTQLELEQQAARQRGMLLLADERQQPRTTKPAPQPKPPLPKL